MSEMDDRSVPHETDDDVKGHTRVWGLQDESTATGTGDLDASRGGVTADDDDLEGHKRI